MIEFLGEVADDPLVCTSINRCFHQQYKEQLPTEIFTAKMAVSSCCLDFEYTIVNGQKRDIKSSSSKIVNDDLAFVSSAVKTICNRSGRWLVYDSNDIQAGNGPGVLRRLSLAVIKVCGNGDNRVLDLAIN